MPWRRRREHRRGDRRLAERSEAQRVWQSGEAQVLERARLLVRLVGQIEFASVTVARCSAVALAGPVMRAVLQVFENYQNARVNFAELATRLQSR